MYGVNCSSRATIYESVPTVAGRFVVHSFASRFDATSIDRKLVAASTQALSINTRPHKISYVSVAVGVNESGASSVTVGVVQPVLPIMNLSSTFPAVFPIIRILYP